LGETEIQARTYEKQGLTGWIKERLSGKKKSAPVDEKFLSDLSELKTIGRYEIVGKLGQGSMGMVFLGRDPYIKRPVAIKISRPAEELSKEKADKFREGFFIEAQSAGRLSQPNIVSIYDAGIYGDYCYITMEYIDGPTLEKYCAGESLLPLAQVVEIVFTACKALDYAHRRGVIHRDVKPSNIMMNSFGSVKITDFGIAHIETDQTSPKGIVGSPSYMSPEQIKEEQVGERSDVFSLGCVLYELLTGEKAFSGDNYFSILYKITHEEPARVREIRPEVPEILEKITHKAIAKEVAERYQSCMDLAYDLRVALRGLKGTVKKSKVEDVIDYIHQVPFFEKFKREQVKGILTASNLIKVGKGKVMVSEGEIDDAFFIILSGRAVVRKNGKTLSSIRRGECFGEMSYLSGQSRGATVIAATDCILMKISGTLLDRSSPSIQLLFLKQFAETLLMRLAKSNQEKGREILETDL
jgi:eukaryotic-like serine/threonine-protein kinase